jgi:serine/threonine protein kinase
MLEKRKEVLAAFLPDRGIIVIEELISGHINDTYLVKTDDGSQYVVQKINKDVFKDVPGLVRNKVLVSQYLHLQMPEMTEEERQRRILTFLPAVSGAFHFEDDQGDFWNAMIYIDRSQTFDIVHDQDIAYEGGKLFGEFLNLTEDFDTSTLIESIPRFHDMSFRFSQFEEALKNAAADRLQKSALEIKKAWLLKEEMHILQHLKEEGKIRLRVTHNDTKISNALFDLEGKGLCVIDTDTIMPGIVHYDFGDAIRTICNSAAEDERDLERVYFKKDLYDAYSRGFLEKVGASITDLEKKYLPLGAKTMTFIMALRFLTDYLNGDIYYKTQFEDHNLVRSKNQLKLIESFEAAI